MRYVIIVAFLVSFFFLPQINALSSNLTDQDIKKSILDLNEQNHKQLEVISNLENKINDTQNFTTALVSEIKNGFTKTQQRNEDVQLLYTVAQVSGIFVAIIGGFFTTKVLSASTERNRLSRQFRQLNSEITKKEEIITYYQSIVDNISITWAEEKVDNFRIQLLTDEEIPEYSQETIFEKFYEFEENTEPDQYEVAVLDDRCDSILNEVRNEIEQRRSGFRGLYGGLFGSSVLSLIPQSNLSERYREASEKLKIEHTERNQLLTQRQQIEDEIKDIALPESATTGIAFLFLALIVGIVIPLSYSYWIEKAGSATQAIGIILFLISVIITLSYFGRVLGKELQQSK